MDEKTAQATAGLFMSLIFLIGILLLMAIVILLIFIYNKLVDVVKVNKILAEAMISRVDN